MTDNGPTDGDADRAGDAAEAPATDGAAETPATDGGTADATLPAEIDEEGGHAEEHHLPPTSAIKRWLVTTNHKDIGILYTITSLFFMCFGGVLALLIRLQLWSPRAAQEGILSAMAYNQAVSLHGLIMVFWFLSPLAFGFANYIVPLQIGARDLAFPRLNALSYWLYLASGLLLFVAFFQGNAYAGGWTMYAPLNIPAYMPSIGSSTTVLALLLFVASVTIGSVNFLTTMHRMRAEGLTLRNLPVFTWSILLTVWMMLFAFAALLAALLILSSDRLLGTTYFAASSPGGSILWTHLFWFFGHPEVYIVFFPALGVMAEAFQTFSGRRIVGRKWFIVAMVLVALQSFIVWMHHMFLTSINLQVKTLFMATTIGISLPFDLMVFALIYTLIKGRIRYDTPFLYAFGSLVLFIVGGITGVFLGAVVLDYEFRGTYWVVAHFHYVMVGGVTALIGGLFYWFPKMSGKTYNEFLGKVSFALFFTGFNLLYFPMFMAWETPRRVFQYRPEYLVWHRLSTVGAFLLAAAFALILYTLARAVVAGDDAAGDPWPYSTTAEWAVPSPPPLENYPGRPTYGGGALEFITGGSGSGEDAGEGAPTADGAGTIKSPAAAQQDGPGTGAAPVEDDPPDSLETDGGDVESDSDVETDGGEVETDGGHEAALAGETAAEHAHVEEQHADHASIWPFVIGVFSFVAIVGFSGLQQGSYPSGAEGTFYMTATLVGSVGVIGALTGMVAEPFVALEGGYGEAWPFDGIENTKVGMWIFLASDVVLFGAFIGAYIFIRFAYGWTEWHPVPHNPIPGLVNTYLLLTSSFAVILALVAAEKNSRKGVVAGLVMTLALGLGFLANKGIEWVELLHEGVWLDTNVRASTYYLTTGLHGAHVTVGLIITVWLIYRAWNGAYTGGGTNSEAPIEYFGLYWHFVDIVWLFLFPLFYII